MTMQQKELAQLLGISPAMVSKLAKRGMPTDTLERAQRWRRRHLELARAKDSRPSTAPGGATRDEGDDDSATSPADDDSADYRLARATRERIRAQREQIELDRLRGSLIDAEEVERVEFTCMRMLRDGLQRIPTRCAAQILGLSITGADLHEIERVLQHEIDAALLEHVSAIETLRQEEVEEHERDH